MKITDNDILGIGSAFGIIAAYMLNENVKENYGIPSIVTYIALPILTGISFAMIGMIIQGRIATPGYDSDSDDEGF
jgi:hypothetical protein